MGQGLIPVELNIQGVFMPPFLLVFFLSLFAAVVTARVMNHYRLGRYFAAPRLVFLSFIAIYLVMIGSFLIRI